MARGVTPMYSICSFSDVLAYVRRATCSVQTDSRKIEKGDVFVAIPGVVVDGASFIPQAVSNGATHIICRADALEHIADLPSSITVATHDDPRIALGFLAQAQFGTDSLPFPIVGITGTNGKTTITYLLEHLFASAGKRVGVLGTVSYRWPGYAKDAPLTTPNCLELHAMLAEMAKAGVDIAFMEVSSHALAQERVAGIRFRAAALTNLTQDHLDYHGDMETYFAAKARLFISVPDENKYAAINADDAWGRKLLAMVPQSVGFGLEGHEVAGHRPLHATMLRCSTSGVHLRMQFDGMEWELDSPLVGAHNASNLLAVQAVALGLGLSVGDLKCLETFMGVSGRLERVVTPQGFDVFVDYAHTPDALINVLKALRAVGFAKIITVFGCGGNRDRTKRPLMGEAVARYADVAVLTSDNPRYENPQDIIDDVLPGLRNASEVIVEVDRRSALEKALAMMQPGDALLVAGKGHEQYQIIGDEMLHFSDQETIREIVGCK